MILPEGHAQRVAASHVLTRRERTMIGGVVAVVAAIVVVLIISLATADRTSGHGCISVGLPYSTGGAKIYRCGAAARSMCASVNQPGLAGAAGRLTARACRTAGLTVG
ncbi:MAG: hypothetical protein JOZ07_19065 [Solirubrobacterales bacterium]|nr:hypothetical protein [Solirubrobacterales bacterium]